MRRRLRELEIRSAVRGAVPVVRAFPGELARRVRRLQDKDLRWSFVLIVALVVIGAAVNFTLAHGWTIWPFVAVVGGMLMVNEAADRNDEGIPPLKVYGLLFAALLMYAVALAVISAFNGLVLVIGMAVCSYYGWKGHTEQVRRYRLIAQRLADHQCVHCGHPADEGFTYCLQCGLEPDPSSAQRRRIAAVISGDRRSRRMRELLTRKPASADAAHKEQALLARRHRRKA